MLRTRISSKGNKAHLLQSVNSSFPEVSKYATSTGSTLSQNLFRSPLSQSGRWYSSKGSKVSGSSGGALSRALFKGSSTSFQFGKYPLFPGTAPPKRDYRTLTKADARNLIREHGADLRLRGVAAEDAHKPVLAPAHRGKSPEEIKAIRERVPSLLEQKQHTVHTQPYTVSLTDSWAVALSKSREGGGKGKGAIQLFNGQGLNLTQVEHGIQQREAVVGDRVEDERVLGVLSDEDAEEILLEIYETPEAQEKRKVAEALKQRNEFRNLFGRRF